jgi:threonine synthase
MQRQTPDMFLLSTQNPALRVSFAEAVLSNVPGDGGLYMPAGLAPFADVDRLLAMPWQERSVEILHRLLQPEFSRDETSELVTAAFDFPVPLVEVAPAVYALELFHGPTLSFKDFGVRFLARLLALLRRRQGAAAPRLVLTATSGDTGAAVAHAFWRLPGFRAAVLYPRGRVSALQERQFATLGDNVRAFAVEGSFDDCQNLVRQCFADPALVEELGLSSANSINVARLLAQVLTFFEGAAQAPRGGGLVFSVPSGNFGNLCAGLLAQRRGAPIAALVAATNANTTVPEYLTSGRYAPRPSVATLSNAMDVGAPNNWQRIEWLFGGRLDALRRALRWGSASDDATRAALAELARLGYAADPHSAVAYAVLRQNLRPDEVGIFLATAHPAKFAATLDHGKPLPPALAEVATRPLLSEPLANDFASLRARLLRWPGAA